MGQISIIALILGAIGFLGLTIHFIVQACINQGDTILAAAGCVICFMFFLLMAIEYYKYLKKMK